MTAHRPLPAYLSRLGLVRNPFPQTPDADHYFSTDLLARQGAEALHCILAGKGFILLTGEVGSGKSTFLRCLMDRLCEQHCSTAFLFNTFLQGHDLLLAINRDFGLAPGADLAADLALLNDFLISGHLAGRTCVAVIDDAQNLTPASLEMLRLLSNLETRQHKLLQVVLSGQPELAALLAGPGIRQLRTRIVQHIELAPLGDRDAARYIDFRLASAASGSGQALGLDRGAHAAIFRRTGGNPRHIHLIMDRCLYGVLATGAARIDRRLAERAALEAGMGAVPARPLRRRSFAAGVAIAVALCAGAAGRWYEAWTPIQALHAAPLAGAHDACLERLGAGPWRALLAQGLNPTTLPAIERTLAAGGLALAPAAPLGGAVCRWRAANADWMLWRPALAPFDLRRGDDGKTVRWLQTRLAAAGHYGAPIDGVAGSQTVAALHRFLLAHGAPVGERVDGATIYLLDNLPTGQNAS
jgi:general secretion pathway protein A